MLEVNNIMRLDLLEVDILFIRAMLDKLPKTLTLVLVHNGDSSFLWLLDSRPILDIFPSLLPLRQRVELVVRIQVNTLIIFREVHEAICEDMVDEQLIIEVDIISIVLIGAMRVDLPNDLGTRYGTHLYGKGAVSAIRSFLQAP